MEDSKLGIKDTTNFIINFIYEENDKKINDPYKISNFMNSFFSSVGSIQIQKPLNSGFILPPINPNIQF